MAGEQSAPESHGYVCSEIFDVSGRNTFDINHLFCFLPPNYYPFFINSNRKQFLSHTLNCPWSLFLFGFFWGEGGTLDGAQDFVLRHYSLWTI